MPLPASLSPFADELDSRSMQVGLAAVSGRTTRDAFMRDLQVIDPLHQLDPYLVVSERTVALYRDAGHRELVAEVGLRAEDAPRPVWRTLVADPGHWGGSWSQLEHRHVTVGAGAPVREGDLTLATALRLRGKVPNVRLTRTHVADTVFPEGVREGYDPAHERRIILGATFSPWLGWPTLLDHLLLMPEERALATTRAYEAYTHYDLRSRPADVQADEIFVSIHYNVASLGQANGIMAFIYGDALEGELSTPSQRFWAVRRALDGTLSVSRDLATRFAWALQRRMSLPPIGPEPDAKRPNKVTLDEKAGVHARNLAVLRRAPGPAVLLEGPCMNAAEEYPRFLSERVNLDGVLIPVRAEEYADAIADVAREFFASFDR
jgi:N-acetylmuramoyl-L-alanine amidase